MILNRLYYVVKPYVPWRVRAALRRYLARRARAASAGVWPIDEAAAAPPPNWPGWPGGKRFAVVMTHDVEGRKGLARVRRLMELERSYGFRSSFNFVPEGDYRVPADLRAHIDREGFEIGIHGLYHDGKLYNSKARFAARAARIRQYAESWGACGFRSPFMHHKLSWLHELGMEYDASTFDTDPFEPQPDGVQTIFPFWVPGENGGGYVELPYTLVQDFSLLVIQGDPTPEVWLRKADWVAKHGGMVLLNCHPDYMCFEGAKQRDEVSIAFYEELLRRLRDKYAGDYWQALPREVARYYRASLQPEARNTRKKVCMVTYSSYENDNRVRRYAESLVARGDQVDVVALSGGPYPNGTEVISGVTAHRIQRRERDEHHVLTYLYRLLRFLALSSAFVVAAHRHKRYDLIHVHNIPDFMVFAAWFPKMLGVKVILDIHDIVPELYASKFKASLGSPLIRMLKRIEKLSMAFADHVIVSNHIWHGKLVERSVAKEKCSVFVNHVDTEIFFPRERTRDDGRFVVIFPGSFQWHQGLDIAIQAMGLVREHVPAAELHIYGGGHEAEALMQLTRQLKLEDVVLFRGSAPLEEIATLIANADVGVVPKRADSFGNEAYSTKIMEFMSQGVPVVASRTRIDTFYYDESEVLFFPSGDVRALADAIVEVSRNPELRERLRAAGGRYVQRHGWAAKKREYLDLVDSLTVERFAGVKGARAASAVSTGQGV